MVVFSEILSSWNGPVVILKPRLTSSDHLILAPILRLVLTKLHCPYATVSCVSSSLQSHSSLCKMPDFRLIFVIEFFDCFDDVLQEAISKRIDEGNML